MGNDMSDAAIRVGQRVRLPWGHDTVKGTVIEVFGPPGRRFVRVAVELAEVEEGVDGPVIALPADAVEAATAA